MALSSAHPAGRTGYAAHLRWTGNLGHGTADYIGYDRGYRIRIAGKPDLAGTADPAFRGEADKHNPEELFLASLAACHMLFYLSLCARNGVRVVGYEDHARGTLLLDARGGGRFEAITLHPIVTIADGVHAARAVELHDTAHERCFIANSCSFRIGHEPVIRIQES